MAEYGVGNEVSTIGDVYSYGILLLELMIREKPSDIMFEGDMNLHKFAKMALPNHVKDIVDSILLNDDEKLVVRGDQKQTQAKINVIIECVISMVRIGVACSMESPQDRMKMTNVVHELQSIKNTLLGPKNLATCKEVILRYKLSFCFYQSDVNFTSHYFFVLMFLPFANHRATEQLNKYCTKQKKPIFDLR